MKCRVSCLNFGFENNFIDRECLTIDMKPSSEYSLIAHAFFVLYKESVTAHYALLSKV